MARLNGRLAINKLDSSKLVNITNEFESTRLKFNSNYNDYDTAMTDLQRAKFALIMWRTIIKKLLSLASS